MEAVLNQLLPKLINPERAYWRIIPHEGKRDLQASIQRKLRAWTNPSAKFVILHDKDASNCVLLKQQLLGLCPEQHKTKVLIRIVCTELESWFIGDLQAVADAFGDSAIARHSSKAKFRTPDSISNASEELKKLIPTYQKVGGARKIAPFLEPERNRSKSFQVFVAGLEKILSTSS
jgi:hypothetical protein